MLRIEAIPAFRDNYIWALTVGTKAVVVDPGDAAPVEAWLTRGNGRLAAIFITHHHHDHIGGLTALKARHHPQVFGPAGEAIAGVDVALAEGDTVTPAEGFPAFRVFEVPGHTAGHIAYYGANLLFCGDTLFSAGCGRLFEGTAAQMHASLGRLAALPAGTRVYPAHEYTEANLRFACSLLPADPGLARTLKNVVTIRADGQATLPSTIGRERGINLFLRSGETKVRTAVEKELGRPLHPEAEVFAALRHLKDQF
ncbi:MAG: hydroxyacylglutathione hydrolase [Gammaproteobacteria bacterium]